MNSEICIPLESLSIGVDGEESSKTPPAVGDPVEFEATGTVNRVEGGQAYLTLESINGEPLPAPDPNALPEGPDEAAMFDMATAADEENQLA